MNEQPAPPSGWLRALLWATDLGFIAYWLVTGLGLLPVEFLFKDHAHPILQAWNLSFLPLDLLASASGLAALRLWHSKPQAAQRLCVISLTLTVCAGLMALSFWALRRDFDLAWWLPNLFLALWPLPYLLRGATPKRM